MAKDEMKISLDGRSIAGLIVKFFEQQRKEILDSKKKERVQMNINPDSFIGKEILYQTALLKSIKEDIAEIRQMTEGEKIITHDGEIKVQTWRWGPIGMEDMAKILESIAEKVKAEHEYQPNRRGI